MPGTDSRRRFAALAALALAGGVLPAAAQDFPAIRVGQEVATSLAANDPALTERGRFKVYRFEAAAGSRYVLTMESDAFDPYVSIARLVGGITDVLKSDDDGGEGTNARLRWTAENAGTYVVIAQSYASEGTGDFRLKLELAPQPTTAAPRALRLGETVTGSLADTDASLEDDDSFYDSYTLQGRRGQRLVVEMASDSFDTFLHFGRMDGGRWNSIRTDDDGWEGTDSRVRVTLEEDGEYVVRANSVGSGETGPYTLQVRERPAPPAPTEQAIRTGARVSGELTDADAVLENEEVYYDLYSFTGRRGERVEVSMESDAFDAYLDLGQMRDGAWHSVKTDDDGGEGTDSRLRFSLTEPGAYLIRARSFGEGGTGRYTLALRDLPPPAVARPQAVRAGQTVNGRLTDQDAVLENEEIHYDLYTVQGRAGQRLVVEMRSDSFDTYLDLGRMEDGAWRSLRTDDDGLGDGTNSRLRYTLTEAGEYRVRARSFTEGATGPYTLVVTEREAGTPTAPRAITSGQTLEGALEDSDSELDDGSFYDVFTYAGRQGEELTLTMSSEAFDTYLQFGRMVGGSLEEIATNDDGEDEGTNSRLVVRLPADGEYVIRANSLGGGQTGAYQVRVARSRDR